MKTCRVVLLSILSAAALVFLGGGNCGYRFCSEVENQLNCDNQAYGGSYCQWDQAAEKCVNKVKTCQPRSFTCANITAQNECGQNTSQGLCKWNTASLVCENIDNTALCSARSTEPVCIQGASPCEWK